MNKRQRTDRRIQAAALHLAAARGIDDVSVEDICAAADVSQRTFFNHFAYKDAVFAIAPPPFSDEAVARFLEGRHSLLDELIELIGFQVADLANDRHVPKVLRDIADNHPRIMAVQLSKMHALDRELAGLIARRLGRQVDDRACSVLASAVNAATRVSIESWAERDSGDLRATVAAGLSHLALFAAAASARRQLIEPSEAEA